MTYSILVKNRSTGSVLERYDGYTYSDARQHARAVREVRRGNGEDVQVFVRPEEKNQPIKS